MQKETEVLDQKYVRGLYGIHVSNAGAMNLNGEKWLIFMNVYLSCGISFHRECRQQTVTYS